MKSEDIEGLTPPSWPSAKSFGDGPDELSFTNEELKRLTEALASSNGWSAYLDTQSPYRIKALLARLEDAESRLRTLVPRLDAAEKIVNKVGEDVPDFLKEDYDAWCKAARKI